LVKNSRDLEKHLRGVRAAQVGALLGGGGGNDETDNETVKSENFKILKIQVANDAQINLNVESLVA
jgi:hypothetical protein